MIRGKQKLYNSIVKNSITELEPNANKRDEQIKNRRDCMATRYYYHADICRKRYDDCLLALTNEFFLTPDTIVKELQERLDYINELVKHKIPVSDLKKIYSYFSW